MGIVNNFNLYKCNKCDSNGFIVKNNMAVLCDCRKKFEYELKTSDILLKSGLLRDSSTYADFKNLIDFDFSDYRGEDKEGNISKIKKFTDEFDSVKYEDVDTTDSNGNYVGTQKVVVPNPFKSIHCYVYGEQGTQKSHVMRGMLTKLACKGKKVYYIFAKDLITLINDSERNEDSQKLLDYIMNVDVLVIDEFNEERCALWQSGYKEKNLIIWIKSRLEIVRKSTWFVTNDTIEKLKEGKFGELFGDLISRETIYGRFHFTDKFTDNLTEKDIEKQMKFIWE